MQKTTGELMDALLSKPDVAQYLEENRGELASGSLAELLNRLLQAHGLQKAQVVAASLLERSYGYHLFNGARANPSRDVLLSLALAMGLTLDETQQLLRRAGQAMLYPRVRRDSVIIRAAADGCTVMECNERLEALGETPLQC